MKTQSKGPGQPKPASPKPEALEDKITNLTGEVAKTANQYKVVALVAFVAIIAIVAIAQLVGHLGEKAEGQRTDAIYTLFRNEDPAKIRAEAPALAKELKGTKIEPYFLPLYARWLFDQNEGNDRQTAVDLLDDALKRHEGEIYLTLAHEEFSQQLAASAGFTLPEIPEPLTPDTPEGTITPLLPGGQTTPGTTVTPVGTSTDDPTPGDSTSTGDSDPIPGDTTPGAAPIPAPTSQPAGDGGR